ncbi:MAG: YidC/Oxa1 family membrane protein insertase [Thermoleophilaceae bacterium]
MILIANVLQPLIDVAQSILTFWHDSAGFSWGASIIMLTVVIRLAILPLTFKQVRSMQDLQRLQPEMKRIQERYKDDRQRMNQEMMKLYQDHKVNPLGSCLPILLQLPFFIALFYLLQDDLRLDICGQTAKPCDEVDPGSADFLFIPDLTDTATGGVLVALIVLYVGTQLVSGLVSTVTADPMQRRIMLALPFVFVIFIINFEAGLIVYWITTNTWTIGQQFLVRKLFPKPEPIAAKPDAGAKPARGKAPAPAAAAVASGKGAKGAEDGGPRKTPPPGPRKKKKRTGRRR